MEGLEFYIQKELDRFGERYTDSFVADEVIKLKTKVKTFLTKKTDGINGFYRSNTLENKISFKITEVNTSLRLVFYKSGNVKILIDHFFGLEKTLKDNVVMSEFCVDAGVVYFIESEFGWKIGKTRNLGQRVKTFEVRLPFVFALRFQIKTSNKSKLERYLHEFFKGYNINGEWFLITEDQIRKCISTMPEYKLSGYSKHDKVIIDKKYLKTINHE
jgi:hypothetical protein